MARKAARGQVYVATETGTAELDGAEYPFHKGVTRVRADSVLTKWKSFDQFFEPADEHVHYEFEQATDAPGETRDVTLPGDAVGAVEDMTVPELREYAKQHGITPGTMNKGELIEAVTAAPNDGED